MDRITEEKITSDPFAAVADSVLNVDWIYYQKGINYNLQFPPKYRINDSRELLKFSSQSYCSYMSTDVLYYATKHYGQLFQKSLLVATEEINDDSWMVVGQKRPQFRHYYFMLQDNAGVWYAGSPANHGINKSDKNYPTTIITGQNLQEVLKRMEERDSAKFPTVNQIEQEMEKAQIQKAVITDEGMHVLTIDHSYDKIFVRNETIPEDKLLPFYR
jgi:hypothetical protein